MVPIHNNQIFVEKLKIYDMQFKILRGTLVLIKNCEYWGIWYFFDESINEERNE